MNMTRKGENAGIDPFESYITIASACQRVFRTNFLKENCIGIIPVHGYKPEQRQSVKAFTVAEVHVPYAGC